jgi:hypothetical protein
MLSYANKINKIIRNLMSTKKGGPSNCKWLYKHDAAIEIWALMSKTKSLICKCEVMRTY